MRQYLYYRSTNQSPDELDELFNILDELLAMEGEKVVIFSQWERMTRLIAQGLDKRKIKFEYLHGGIPGKNRESLFTNFNNDPDCKVFLSTDAGGVGLNLQVASNLINMDIPWNPAVLEQRIGRIHRMGQKKNISVTNLVAQGTIEHRLLSVLQFKTSIAAGILDNGEDNIFLGDDWFKQFMQSVESITQEIPQESSSFDIEEQEEIAPVTNGKDKYTIPLLTEDKPVQQVASANTAEPNENNGSSPAALVKNGMNFFTELINTLHDPLKVKQLAETITEKDERTGQTWLKLPVENEKTVEKGLQLLAGLLNGFGK